MWREGQNANVKKVLYLVVIPQKVSEVRVLFVLWK